MSVRVLGSEAGRRVIEFSQEFKTWGAPAGRHQKMVEIDEDFIALNVLVNGALTCQIMLLRQEMDALVFLYTSYKQGDGPGYSADGVGVLHDSAAHETRYVRLSGLFLSGCIPPKLSGTVVAFDRVCVVFWQIDDDRLYRLELTRAEMEALVSAYDLYDPYG